MNPFYNLAHYLIIFNPIASTILKSLRFKVSSWMHDFHPFTAMVWDFCIVGLLRLHQIQTLADVTMATNASTLTAEQKRHKGCDVTMATRDSYLL
jgi:hypothetical protein